MKNSYFFSRKRYNGLLTVIFALLLGSAMVLQPMIAVNGAAQQRRSSRSKRNTNKELAENLQYQHVLTRLGFGPRPGDIERLKETGIPTYIDQQLQPALIDDSQLDKRLAGLPTLGMSSPAIAERYYPPSPPPKPSPSPVASPSPIASPMPGPSPGLNMAAMVGQTQASISSVPGVVPAAVAPPMVAVPSPSPSPTPKPPPPKNPRMVIVELQRAALLRATYTNRQLFEVLVNFWENHFSIFGQKDSDQILLTSFDRDVIRPFALGRFRDLLGATAHSPAMLFYLDNWQSQVLRSYPAVNGKPGGTSGGINENYARELLELHTLGVDGGYTQKDVQEVARCFTGWTIRNPNAEGLTYFNPVVHDKGEKIVLGHRIPAGGGIGDVEMVLDILARHPSTAHFIATKLARRFISDDPPASVVNRAADVFLKTDGSILETLRTIITSPEFMAQDAYRSKTRSPFEYSVAALRALDAETDGDSPILSWLSRMGQASFGRISPDGYPDRGDQWVSPGTLLDRLNFANALVSSRIKGTRVDLKHLFHDSDYLDPAAVAEKFIGYALAGDISDKQRATVATLIQENSPRNAVPAANASFSTTAATSNPSPPPPLSEKAQVNAAITVLTLLIGSPDFQRR